MLPLACETFRGPILAAMARSTRPDPRPHRPARKPAADLPVRASRGASWRGLLWRWRHVFLAIGVAAAVVAIADALSPDEGEDILVLAVDRPAGHVLSTDDLRTESLRVPPSLVLESVDEAVGRSLAVALPSGTALSPGMLVGPGMVEAAPAGSTVMTIAVADPGSSQLSVPGSKVTLVGEANSADGVLQVPDVLVLSRLDPTSSGGLLAAESQVTFVLVAVPSQMANLVLQFSAASPLRVVVEAGR